MLAYIHIGCEKTGTTSVQAFLETNAQVIEAAGWALPRSGWFPNTTRLALSCMDRSKSDPDATRLDRQNSQKTNADWREDIWTSVEIELASATGAAARGQMVTSSEYFQAKLESHEELSLLKQRFESIGVREFRVIVYLRRQVEYAISRYSTALRAGYSRREILPEQLSEGNALFNYDRLLERWSAVFGREAMDVRIYDRAQLINGNIIDDFSQAVGLPKDLSGLVQPERQNTALPIQAQMAIRALNEALETKGIAHTESVALRRSVINRLAATTSGSSLAPSKESAIEFQGRFEASNSRVARSWFSRDELFDNRFDYPEELPNREAMDEMATLFASSVVDDLALKPIKPVPPAKR